MKRREFLKKGLGGWAGLQFCGSRWHCRASTSVPTRRPNIIFILADDLGYGDLGCYGQRKIRTPHLDGMAVEGMRFTEHYSGSSVCQPARCSLMTGRHTGHATIRENSVRPLAHDDVTIAQVLQKAGYRTGLVGKWGLGEEGSRSTPDKAGFDFWCGFLNQGVAHFYYAPWIWRNGEKIQIPENANGGTGLYVHDLFTREALSFIEENRSRPFFLYLAYTIPHAEMAVPEDSLREYRGTFPERPKKEAGGGGGGYGTGLPGYCAQATPNACYAAMVSRMDRDIKKIVDALKKHGLDEDTLVVFTSDNGPSGEGGNSMAFFDSNGPLRAQKASLYEGGLRVPLIARWPGTIRPGSVSKHISAFWDFYPTFVELAGAAVSERSDGISLAPMLRGDRAAQQKHEFLYWELGRKRAQAVRMGQWKGLRFLEEDRFELYNLEEDIGETNDLSQEYPQVAAAIVRAMDSAHTPSTLFPLPRERTERKPGTEK